MVVRVMVDLRSSVLDVAVYEDKRCRIQGESTKKIDISRNGMLTKTCLFKNLRRCLFPMHLLLVLF